MGTGSADLVSVKYPNEGGYTPGDTWDLYIGKDNRIEQMVYHRGEPKKPSLVIASWAGYKKAGPLLVSTEHRGTADGGPLHISFSNVADKTVDSDTWMGRNKAASTAHSLRALKMKHCYLINADHQVISRKRRDVLAAWTPIGRERSLILPRPGISRIRWHYMIVNSLAPVGVTEPSRALRFSRPRRAPILQVLGATELRPRFAEVFP